MVATVPCACGVSPAGRESSRAELHELQSYMYSSQHDIYYRRGLWVTRNNHSLR